MRGDIKPYMEFQVRFILRSDWVKPKVVNATRLLVPRGIKPDRVIYYIELGFLQIKVAWWNTRMLDYGTAWREA